MTEKFRLTWRKFASALTKFRGEISSNFREIKEQKTPNFVCISFAQYCTSIENYFFIVLIIIFRGIANLFLGLQCFVGLAVEVDWFESLTSLGDHFENFEVEECFQRECQGETLSGKKRKRFHLSFKICQEPVVCALMMTWLHDSHTILTLIEHDMSAQLDSSLPNLIPRVLVPYYTCWLSERRCCEWKCLLPRTSGRISRF